MSKQKKIKKWINCEPFQVCPLFLANCSASEYRKEITKLVDLDELELYDLEFTSGQQSTFSPTKKKGLPILRVIWIRDFNKNNPDDIATLAHEVCHLVNRIHNHKGIPFDGSKNNDETFSYLVGFFISQFLKNV